ncbi:MAG: hypothetical protein IJB97_06050 [Clostridia bacterium]|nr:hypothetical protein [Clostridia bacterium]
MKYHGKKWLYEFLRDKGYAIPKLKDFYYAKWRGDEWIRGDEFFVMSYLGKAISLTVFAFDDDGERYEIEYYTFRLQESGEWKQTYYRDRRTERNNFKGYRTAGV